MTQNNVIKPLLILEGHDGVEDISFKNNVVKTNYKIVNLKVLINEQ